MNSSLRSSQDGDEVVSAFRVDVDLVGQHLTVREERKSYFSAGSDLSPQIDNNEVISW